MGATALNAPLMDGLVTGGVTLRHCTVPGYHIALIRGFLGGCFNGGTIRFFVQFCHKSHNEELL